MNYVLARLWFVIRKVCQRQHSHTRSTHTERASERASDGLLKSTCVVWTSAFLYYTIYIWYMVEWWYSNSKPAKAMAMDRSLCVCMWASSIEMGSFIPYYTKLNFGRVMQSPFFSIITQAKTHAHTIGSKNNFLRLQPLAHQRHKITQLTQPYTHTNTHALVYGGATKLVIPYSHRWYIAFGTCTYLFLI